jgi:hypothetical protein
MTQRRRWASTTGRVALAALALVALTTGCGGSGGGAVSAASGSSVCSLAKQADSAVLSGEGSYAGREGKLASDFRKASIPKSDSAEDVAALTRLRSETAASIEAVARVPKGDAVALDRAKGAVEGNLADISANALCAESGGGPNPRATTSTTARPCPNQAIKMSAPGPWTKVKDDYEKDNWAATVTLTNPNSVPFQIDQSTALINYTGGRVPTALIDRFNAFVPTADQKTGLQTPLVGPGQTIKVTLEAIAGQQVSAITTAEVFATGHFVFADGSCPGTIDGAKPFNDAPAPKLRSSSDPKRVIPRCGAGDSALDCT